MLEHTPIPLATPGAGVDPLPVAPGLTAASAAPWQAASLLAPSLSPSRAGDFMTCPLLYRFRTIDRIPEKPSKAAVRGTLVHRILEELFDLPADERTLPTAAAMVPAAWDFVRSQDDLLIADLFENADEAEEWLASAIPLLEAYFRLEDPRTLEPADRELRIETTLNSGLVLRGFIDRVDRNAAGEIRVVDYKTGKAPREGFEQKSLFQMRFYALVLWRTTGTVPRVLQLLYLGSEDTIRYTPTEADLLATERKVIALWAAIERAHQSGEWRPSPSRLCDWCDHKVRCPSFGGTPPPLPGRELTPGPISG